MHCTTCIIPFIDVQDPIIIDVPENITQNTDDGRATATVHWTQPMVSDNSDYVTLTSSQNSGSSCPIGVTTVRYTATDVAGNVAHAEFIVTIKGTISIHYESMANSYCSCSCIKLGLEDYIRHSPF